MPARSVSSEPWDKFKSRNKIKNNLVISIPENSVEIAPKGHDLHGCCFNRDDLCFCNYDYPGMTRIADSLGNLGVVPMILKFMLQIKRHLAAIPFVFDIRKSRYAREVRLK